MKTVVLLSIVAFAVHFVGGSIEFCATSSDRMLDVTERLVSDIITSRFRGDSRTDDPKLPTGDEIHFDNQRVDLCGLILCISANLTKVTLSGLNGLDVIKLDFKSDGTRVTIELEMLLRKLQLDAEYYEMRGNIMQALPLAGEGRLYFEATGIRIWTTIELQVTDHTSIESFKNSGFNISSIFSRTEFDGNIDGIFNAMLGELLTERLNRFNKAIAAHCGDFLKEIINPILN